MVVTGITIKPVILCILPRIPVVQLPYFISAHKGSSVSHSYENDFYDFLENSKGPVSEISVVE